MKATGRVARLETWLQDARLAALHDLTAADLRALRSGLAIVDAGGLPSEAQQAACDKWMHHAREHFRARTLGKYYSRQPWHGDTPSAPAPPAPAPPRYAAEAYAPPAAVSVPVPPAAPEAQPWDFQAAREQFRREMRQQERWERRRTR